MLRLRHAGFIGLILLLFLALGCAASNVDRDGRVFRKEPPPQQETAENETQPPAQSGTSTTPSSNNSELIGTVEFGKASYYSDSYQGKKTLSGEPYDRNKLTAAHPSLPMGTRCRVTNLKNGKSVELHVNDKCSPKTGRILDLSYEAASRLDGISAGIMDVKMEVIE